MYIWDETTDEPYTIDVRAVFQSYFKQHEGADSGLSHDSFEMLVASWLSEVIHAPKPGEIDSETSTKWLFDSGLYQAIKGGVCGIRGCRMNVYVETNSEGLWPHKTRSTVSRKALNVTNYGRHWR
ncbi:MAG: hypothetical protein GY801_45895 [bacterium]|nr:hypothetical protein [bacterium]